MRCNRYTYNTRWNTRDRTDTSQRHQVEARFGGWSVYRLWRPFGRLREQRLSRQQDCQHHQGENHAAFQHFRQR